jgi:hypothetical protein
MKSRRSERFRSSFAASLCLGILALGLGATPDTQAGYVTACNTYDWNNWNNAYPWGNSHNGSAYMYSSQVNLQGSWMQIHAQRSGAPSGYNFKSGTIYYKNKIRVDDQHLNWTIEGSFKADPQSGSWPAMWLCYAYGWPPESDIMEFKGSSYCWQNTFQSSGSVTEHVSWVSDPYGTSHTYKIWMSRVDSTYVNIDYYIDGNWKARDKADFTGKDMWLIIDFQTEGSSGTAYFNDSYLTGGGIHIGYTTPDSGPSSGTYKIVARHSGKAMDAYKQETGNGTQIQQYSYWGGSGQKWTVTDTGSGYYKIIGVQSGKSLDIDYSNGGTANGTKVQLWSYWNGASQQFKFAATDSGYYRITPNCATGSCLDVKGKSTADRALVQLYQWNGGNNQQWALQSP